MAGAVAEAQRGGVCGHQAQAVPGAHQTGGACLRHQPVVQGWQCRRGQLGAGAPERAVGHIAHQLGLLVKVGEEFVEFGLDALAHAAEHDRDQRGQRQLALAREGARMFGMARQFEEL